MKTQHLGVTPLVLLGLFALSGCIDEKKRAVPPPPTPQSATITNESDGVINAVQLDAPVGAPRNAQPSIPMVFQLVCYQITVPVGTVSRKEEFWKRIDEQSLDPARYDLLRRNGMRMGVAPMADFDSLRAMLEDSPSPANVMGTLAADAKNMELPMRKEIQFQTINYYGNRNELTGRTFDRCEDILNISYRRAPRKLDEVRLTMAPMVRSTKKRLEYTAKNDEIEISYVAPVKFYLDIEVDLPMDKLLVLGASETSDLPTIIGHQFFLKDEASQQMEQVLIFAAQPYRLEEPKMAQK